MARRPNKPATPNDAAKAKRRRLRAPQLVILRLRTDLEANEHHPLARLDPAIRSEQREALIAAILARLANGPPVENPAATDPLSTTPSVESP